MSVDGTIREDELDVLSETGGWSENPTTGLAWCYGFTAPDDNLDVRLLPGSSADTNPFINAFALQVVPEPGTAMLLLAGAIVVLIGRPERTE